MHQGMTSSDVLDTCLAVQLKQAADILLDDLDQLLDALKRRAVEHKYTPTVGRSHGIHAEPTTFGLKLAGHWAEFARNRERLVSGTARDRDLRDLGRGRHLRQYRSVRRGIRRRKARPHARAGLDAGHPARPARGVFHDPGADRRRHRAAGDRDSPSAAHRTARGRGVFCARAEGLVGDAAQAQPGPVGKPDRAGAADPLARDPGAWKTSRCGTSATSPTPPSSASSRRTPRSRSISRLARLTGLIDRLVVYPERMRENLKSLGGLVDSQRVLLALTQAGMSREDAYRVVQSHAMAAYRQGQGSFADRLKSDPAIRNLTSRCT